ncbi:hypothetical protein, conserved [Eimeria maxima]|uniref:Uncharacterized protein n=1 Tax=Eimeria maxima TaxID=5804 RepID=U6M2F4_EIMMA|nr:hypothetical protein, conserved [Eimeria maxima]CDJ58191.1 hypothetical protein, conserved [Eimeria maxima]
MLASGTRCPCCCMIRGAIALHQRLLQHQLPHHQLVQRRYSCSQSSAHSVAKRPTQQQMQQLQKHQQQQKLPQHHRGLDQPSRADAVPTILGRFVAACRSFERQQQQQQQQGIDAGSTTSLLAARAAIASAPVVCIQALLQALQQHSLHLSLLLPLADAFYVAAEKTIQQKQQHQHRLLLLGQQQQHQQRQAAEDILQLALLLQPRSFVLGGKQQKQQIEELLLLQAPQTRQQQQRALMAAMKLLSTLLLHEQPVLVRESLLARALVQASDQGLQQLLQQAAAKYLRHSMCDSSSSSSVGSNNSRVALAAALLRSFIIAAPPKDVKDAIANFLIPVAAATSATAAKSPPGSNFFLQKQQQLAAWCDVAAALCLEQQQLPLVRRLLPGVQAAICCSLLQLQQQQPERGLEAVRLAARMLEPAAAALVLIRERAEFAANAASGSGDEPESPDPRSELFSRAIRRLVQQQKQRQQQQRKEHSEELTAAVTTLQETFLRLWRKQQQQDDVMHRRHPVPRPSLLSPFSVGAGAAQGAAVSAEEPAAARTVAGVCTRALSPLASTDSEAALLGLLHQLLLLADIPGLQQLNDFLHCVSREVLPACDLQQLLLLLQRTAQLQEQRHQQPFPALDLGNFVGALLLAIERNVKPHQHDSTSSSRLQRLIVLADVLFSPSLRRHMRPPSSATAAAASSLVDQLLLEIQLLQRQQRLAIEQRLELQQQVVLAVLKMVSGAHSLLQLGEDNSAPLVAAAGCDEAWQGGKAAAAAAADIFHGLLCSPLLLQVLSEMINMLHSTGEIVAAAAAGASTTESAVGGHQQDQHSGSVSTAAVHRHSNGLVLAAAALTRLVGVFLVFLLGCMTLLQSFSQAAETLQPRQHEQLLRGRQQPRVPQLPSSCCKIFEEAFDLAVCGQNPSKLLEPRYTSLARFRGSPNRVGSLAPSCGVALQQRQKSLTERVIGWLRSHPQPRIQRDAF